MFRGRKDREQNKNRHRGTAANNNQAPQPPHQSKRIRARGSESTGRLLDASIHSNISTDASKHVRRSTVDRVSFTTIEIREYARTLGDNPSCTSGPPVSISWEYWPSTFLSVDDYEGNRPPRRTNIEMILPRDLRQRMLRKEWDVTQNQIAAQVRTNIRIKNQRRTTVNNLDKSTKVEETVENARRVIANVFGSGSKKKMRELEELMKNSEKARQQTLGPELSRTCDESHPEVPMDLVEDETEKEEKHGGNE